MSKNSSIQRHVTLLASLGSTLEYYDFVIYGMMASYLSAVFFPPQNLSSAVLQSFLVFAVGYFARPLGGTLIGIIGDKFGRRPAFLISTTLMALSTLLIALLPSYATMGKIAVLSLVLCRVIQGLSFGAELPGAMTIVGEFSPNHRKGWGASLVFASTSLGALTASAVLYAIAAMLSKDEIIAWGWRLPFLGGGILGLLLLIARNTIQETPVFESVQAKSKNHQPFINLLGTHKLSLLRGAALTAFMAAMIITNLYFPYYIPKYFGYEPQTVYLATTISLIFSMAILPFMGMLADFFPQKTTTVQWVCAIYIVLSVPFFSLLLTGNTLCLIGFLMIQQFFIAIFGPCFFPILLRIFSPEVRYTGVALCYNITWATMATLPMGFTVLLEFYATPWCVPIMLSGIAAFSCAATRGLQETPQEAAQPQDQDTVKLELAG